MYVLYSLAIVLLAVVLSPWFVYQALRYRKYVGSVGQRMGVLPVSIETHRPDDGPAVTARSLAALRKMLR